MKKIIAGIILASAVACGFAAKPRLKDHITEIRLGKYEPAELGTGTRRLEKTFGHELVAVETGKNIDDVTDALVKAAADDLAGMPEFEHCETAAYAPEPIKDFRKVRRYQYEMTGIVYPPNADKNILIDYGIVETEE